MNLRRFFLEAGAIAVIAIAIALVSNALAPRDKKLNLVGDYPNARVVPKRSAAPIPDRVATTDAPSSDATTAAAVSESAVPARGNAANRTASTTSHSPATESVPSTAIPAAKPATTTTLPLKSPAHHATRAEILRRFPPTPDTQYQEISGDDAAWLHANGVLFLDARRTSSYDEGHIAGARSFPVWESDITNRIGALLNEVTDQDMPIVVYCSGGECEDSHMLAQKLWGVFYSNVLVYKDGFPDWQKRGGAIDTGDAP